MCDSLRPRTIVPMQTAWLCALAAVILAVACRGTVRCSDDERFDESGRCTPISSCPSGRDPSTGVCDGMEPDGGSVDASGDDAGSTDAAGPCPVCEPGEVCFPELERCGECQQDVDCGPDRALCRTAELRCVECLGSSDCRDTNAALCSSGRCVGCESDSDCSRFGGTPVCDEASDAWSAPAIPNRPRVAPRQPVTQSCSTAVAQRPRASGPAKAAYRTRSVKASSASLEAPTGIASRRYSAPRRFRQDTTAHWTWMSSERPPMIRRHPAISLVSAEPRRLRFRVEPAHSAYRRPS